MKFQIIVADPPYEFSDKLSMDDVKRGSKANYNTMSIKDISNLPIQNISDPEGCLLALWVPSSLLQEGLDIMKTWGFKQTQTYIWVKVKKEPFKFMLKPLLKKLTNIDKTILKQLYQTVFELDLDNLLAFFMGRLFRQTHEICLVGINNKKIYKKLKNKSQRSVSFAPNLKHSSKPDALQSSLEKMFPNCNKLEIFGRRDRDDWYVIGNECPTTFSEDVSISINKLMIK